jgi:hypothetical protein
MPVELLLPPNFRGLPPPSFTRLKIATDEEFEEFLSGSDQIIKSLDPDDGNKNHSWLKGLSGATPSTTQVSEKPK